MEAVPRTFFQHFSQHSPTCVRFSFMSHLVMTAFHGPFFFHPFSSFSSRQSIGGKFHSRLPCPGKTTLSQTRTAFFRFPDAGHSLSEYMPAVTKHLPHVTTKKQDCTYSPVRKHRYPGSFWPAPFPSMQPWFPDIHHALQKRVHPPPLGLFSLIVPAKPGPPSGKSRCFALLPVPSGIVEAHYAGRTPECPCPVCNTAAG